MSGFEPDPRFDAFAAREPYFAVLTAAKFLKANLTPQHEREFFAGGEELVDWIFHVIGQRIAPRFSPMSTLEYGCGVGRVALPLATRPGAVTAVDRSPAMLATATREAERRGISHIEFVSPSVLFGTPRTFDLVTCVHLLQRLPTSEGLALIRALMARTASGGIAVFHLPFRTTASPFVRALRWAREHVGVVNGLANQIKGTPFGDPLIPAHTYDLDEVLAILDQASAAATHVVIEHEPELSSAIIFAQVPLPSVTGVDERGRPLPGATLRVRPSSAGEEQPIDVTRLVAETPIEELNRTAEQYFASLADWSDHLAKPFSQVVETPRLLTNAATLLHGLRLTPGATVLEFGAGTGWLSRFLTQLGCRVILLDVSPTALEIARELYRRVPIIGDRPAPVFLLFDGRRIDLPDASVARILTFDALHHTPNPEEVIAEFGRILSPGGIVGCSEPGARHSQTPMSQFEMRTYGVVENDIDVHAIWRTAQRSGFRDMKVAVFNGTPFYVSLPEYEDLLAAGQTSERWLTATRVFQRDARNFFLFKDGDEPVDSRAVHGLACDITAARAAGSASASIVIDATVTNTGAARWLAPEAEYGGVRLGAHLYAASGRMLNFDFACEPLTNPSREIAPGERIRMQLVLPTLPPGQYRIELDCVASRVTWFAQVGSVPATVMVEVPAPRS